MNTANPLFPGKQFISTILEVLETKTVMSGTLTRRYLQRAAMAGMIIGLFYATHYAVVAGFGAVPAGADGTWRPVGRLVAAVVFGWALVFIYYTRSELLTSTMMVVCVGAYHRRTRIGRATRLLVLCYLGNAVGGLLVAVLFRFSTLADGPVAAELTASVDRKLAYLDSPAGWGDLLVRAILCNFCINIAMLLVYNGLIKDDLTKCLVMITAVFVFAFLGLEHSVANTVLFTIVGLRDGIDLAAAAGNLGIALVGNFIGGGLLIGLYYAWVNDDSRWSDERRPAAGPPD